MRRQVSRWHRQVALCACAALLFGGPATGCGRKGPPRPPEDVLPAAIADLAASSVDEGIQLSWTRPTTYTDGSRMLDLGGFVVLRFIGGDSASPPQAIADLPVTDRDRFRQIKRFRYLDVDTIVGGEYGYEVVSYTLDGYVSASSNIVTIERAAMSEEGNAPLPTPQR
jgi:predicted small lipoprotein YifL